MKLAIIGSRSFENYDLLCHTIKVHFLEEGVGYWFDHVISGGARGSDFLARKWVDQYGVKQGITIKEILPEWDKYGKSAGMIRNKDIIEQCDFVLSFWDGLSKGTANSLAHAKRLKKDSLIIYF